MLEVLVLFVTLLMLVAYRQARKPVNFPPGPPKLPFLGSIPFIAKWKSLMDTVTNLSKEYGPICGFFAGGTPTVIISELETVQKVFKLEELSARPPMALVATVRYGNKDGTGAKGLVMSSGEEWREQRRFALRNLRDFGFGKKSMEGIISHEVAKLCNYLKKDLNRPTSLDSKLNISIVSALWVILVGEELSLDDEKLDVVVKAFNEQIRAGSPSERPFLQLFPFLAKLFPNLFFKKSADMFTKMKALVGTYMSQHRETFDKNNLRDFLDVHIDAQLSAQPGSSFYGLTGQQHEEVNLLDLFAAGSETTSTTITWGIFYLLHHPEIQDKIHQELDMVVGQERLPTLDDEPHLPYCSAVVEEVHRCASLVHIGVPHYAVADVEVDGYVIPKGSRVFGNLCKIMHNPDVFPEPEQFKPDRFLDDEGKFAKHPHVVPFGMGKRVCLGSSLAEKELFLFFSALLHTFQFQNVPGQKLPSYFTHGRDVAPVNGLIRVCPRYQLIIRERNH